jgi:hypothetical protein
MFNFIIEKLPSVTIITYQGRLLEVNLRLFDGVKGCVQNDSDFSKMTITCRQIYVCRKD